MLICNALVPKMRARSYLVMYGVVVRSASGIFLSRSDFSDAFMALAAAAGSPDGTTLS
jgi:hypothetical protein